MRDDTFRQVRYSLYLAFLLSGAMVQWLLPFHYQCNITGQPCFACGLRTVVSLLLRGHFREAYGSNKLIVVALAVFAVMAADVGHYLGKRFLSPKE